MEDLLQCCVFGAVFNQTKVYLEDEDINIVPPPFFSLLLFALPKQKRECRKMLGFSDRKNRGVLRLQPWKRAAYWKSAKRWWFRGHFGGVSAILGVKIWEIFFASKIFKKKDMYQEIDLKGSIEATTPQLEVRTSMAKAIWRQDRAHQKVMLPTRRPETSASLRRFTKRVARFDVVQIALLFR